MSVHSCPRRVLAVLVIALGTFASATASACAATVARDSLFGGVFFTDSASETNTVTVTRGDAGETIIRDSTAVTVDGDGAGGCAVAGDTATCAAPVGSLASLSVSAGGGADQVTVGDTLPASFPFGVSVGGGDGSDMLNGGAQAESLDGGAGVDTITGAGGGDRLAGGDANDRIVGGDGNDSIDGDAGNDDVHGDAGNDSIEGGDGVDLLAGDAGNDTIYGAVNDIFNPDTPDGADMISGGDGADVIDAGVGNDMVDAGAGDDQVSGAMGDDRIDGGPGDDAQAFLNVIFGPGLVGGPGNDIVTGGDGIDSLDGGGGTDQLFAGAGDDFLTDGDDEASGTVGPDVLDGGAGRDRLDYSRRTLGLVVNLSLPDSDAGNAGAPGENDDVDAIEDVRSGTGADVLTGGPLHLAYGSAPRPTGRSANVSTRANVDDTLHIRRPPRPLQTPSWTSLTHPTALYIAGFLHGTPVSELGGHARAEVALSAPLRVRPTGRESGRHCDVCRTSLIL